MTAGPREVRAPRGTTLTAKSWQTEAPMRMLMNNLDPEVAERPNDLVVYGGTGKAARNWDAFDAIIAALKDLNTDETLLIQSPGHPASSSPTPTLSATGPPGPNSANSKPKASSCTAK